MMSMTSIKWFFIVLAIHYSEDIFTSGACIDTHSYCAFWASKGQCQANYLYMLHKCPSSCRVSSGGVSCVNKYNDAYCLLHAGNCWRQSYATVLINNCRKTCVCSCCPTTPGTTPANATTTTPPPPPPPPTTTTKVTSSKVSNTPQTTTERNGDETTTVIPHSTQKASAAKETNTLQTTTTNSYNIGQDSAAKTQRSEFDTILLLSIIAGVVVVIGILSLSLFCFWRRKRSGSLQTPRMSPPPTEASQISETESITYVPFYHVLEGPNGTSPRKDQALSVHYEQSSERFRSESNYNDPAEQGTRAMIGSSSSARENVSPIYHVLEGPNDTSPRKDQALSVHYERSSERFRLESSDYDDPVEKGTVAMIGSSLSARENDAQYETVNKVRNPKHFMNDISNCPTLDNGVEYCYSYNVANQDLSLEVSRNRQREVPNEQDPRYHVLARANYGYQSLERPSDVTGTDGAYEPMRDIKPSNYQDLDQTTQSFYHPLKKAD